ncbi:MAG: ribonuclease III [Pseudomonadota bacterium]
MKAERPKRTRLRRAGADKRPALSKQDLGKLEDILGYKFSDNTLINMAMTHPSALTSQQRYEQSNQRLEFLGDRVLGLVIAERLYLRRPDEAEGKLAPRLNRLVRKEACVAAAEHKGLGEFVMLGESERRNGGSRKDKVLGDVCEAVIGAIYLDGGLTPARKFIESAWVPVFEQNKAGRVRDPKSLLQEWAQARKFELPRYKEIRRTGPDHSPSFSVEVDIANGKYKATGDGSSKQDAERAAAAKLFEEVEGDT